MQIDTSSLEALYAVISSRIEISSDDDKFISLLNSRAYRELRNDNIDHYSGDSTLNIVNGYIKFKSGIRSESDNSFINSRLQLFEKEYPDHNSDVSEILNSSRVMAFEYLPADFNYAEPAIAFAVLFHDQELAWSLDNCIITNYTNLFEFTDFNQKILAHELHHHYARQITKQRDDSFFQGTNGNIFLFVTQMANEGIAELISMPFVLKSPGQIGETGYKIFNEYKSINEHLTQFTDILKLHSNDLEKLNCELLKLRKNGFVFHLLSYYIIDKINSVFGKDTLFEIIKFPLTVFTHYNKSVLSLGEDNSLLACDEFISLLENNNHYYK